MGQAQPLAGWFWALSVVHAQMGPCSYIELRVWRCRTNRRTHHSDMPRTSGTHRNTWTDGFGCRHTMLAEHHHCQHLISKQWMIQQFNNIAVLLLFLTWMWIPFKGRRLVAVGSTWSQVPSVQNAVNKPRKTFANFALERLSA